jgi:hypothetical protein
MSVRVLRRRRVLAVQDLDVGQVQQVLAMLAAWEPASPTESRSEGLWALAHWMSPPRRRRRGTGAGPRRRLLTASTPEAHLLPHLVADHDAQVAGVRRSRASRAPSWTGRSGRCRRPRPRGVEPGQRQRLDGGVPVDGDGGVVVEQAGQRPGDELARGRRAAAGSRRGSAGWRRTGTARRAPSVGWSSRCHSCGMVVSTRWVLPAVYPVRSRRAALTTFSSTGPNGTRSRRCVGSRPARAAGSASGRTRSRRGFGPRPTGGPAFAERPEGRGG